MTWRDVVLPANDVWIMKPLSSSVCSTEQFIVLKSSYKAKRIFSADQFRATCMSVQVCHQSDLNLNLSHFQVTRCLQPALSQIPCSSVYNRICDWMGVVKDGCLCRLLKGKKALLEKEIAEKKLSDLHKLHFQSRGPTSNVKLAQWLQRITDYMIICQHAIPLSKMTVMESCSSMKSTQIRGIVGLLFCTAVDVNVIICLLQSSS